MVGRLGFTDGVGWRPSPIEIAVPTLVQSLFMAVR
jgi:hypothetical protein